MSSKEGIGGRPVEETPPSLRSGHQEQHSAGQEEAVWRVCRVIKGECRNCPETEVIGGDECMRGCFLQAQECINTVETGNPWRKTSGVRKPWVVLFPADADASSRAEGSAGNLPPDDPLNQTPPSQAEDA